MPNTAAWKALAKEAFGSLHRGDAADLYRVDWHRVSDELLAEHEGVIAAEPRRWKRWLRRASAVIYGLSKRLTRPAARLSRRPRADAFRIPQQSCRLLREQ